jgi:hypothetical protein
MKGKLLLIVYSNSNKVKHYNLGLTETNAFQTIKLILTLMMPIFMLTILWKFLKMKSFPTNKDTMI